jgi:hypothetical protein
METMNEWEPALTKEECNSKELGACYCGECEREGAGKCKGCETPMWLEGKIDDDIQLCHACYQDDKLRIQYTKEGESNG